MNRATTTGDPRLDIPAHFVAILTRYEVLPTPYPNRVWFVRPDQPPRIWSEPGTSGFAAMWRDMGLL